MVKIRKERLTFIIIFLTFTFLIPTSIISGDTGKGNLIGFIYGEDKTTPVEGAIFILRNIATGIEYSSQKTNDLGIFKLEDIDPGLYIVGITSGVTQFNFKNLIGIKAEKTAKVSFALIEEMEEKNEKPQSKSTVKKKGNGFLGFFASASGIAITTAAAGSAVIAIVSTTGKDKEASAFK